MATREKNIWILLLFILSGIVVGGLLGNLAGHVDFLSWLAYGEEFGLSTPIELDLNVVKLTFGLMFKINIASIIGIVKACNDNEEPEISGIGEIAKSLFKKQIEQ